MNAEEVLKSPKWPEKWPFYDDDFNRMDETSDGDFYSQPRLVYHIGAWPCSVLRCFQCKPDAVLLCGLDTVLQRVFPSA